MPEKDWRRKLKRWRGSIGKKRHAEALQHIHEIRDPLAAAALAEILPDESNHEMKLLYVEVLGRLVGSKPGQSSVTRVLWYLLRLAEESMKLRASRAPQLKRPPNGFGFEMLEYEQQLAQFLLKGIKDVEL